MKPISPAEASFAEIFIIPIKHKANGFRCVNVVIGGVKSKDIRAIFGPLTGKEEMVRFDGGEQWGHLLNALGIFRSISQARKNGWAKEIELGFSEAVFKKQRKVVFVLKNKPPVLQTLWGKVINTIKAAK